MKHSQLKEIIKKKASKIEFAIVTNLENGLSEIYEPGDFSGSVSGGCVEPAVVRECIGLIKDNKPCKKIEFKVSNESAWEVGLACGGEIAVYLEQIN